MDWVESSKLGKMFNKKLTLNSAKNKWDYLPGEEIKWQFTSLADKYSFFAYFPYALDIYDVYENVMGNGLTVTTDKITGIPEVTYTVPQTRIASQPDLMFALPKKNNRYTNGAVKLEMQHALSQITFAARTSGYTGGDVKIKKIEISNILCQSRALMDGSMINWIPAILMPQDIRNITLSQNTSDLNNPSSLKDYTLTQTTTTDVDISTSNGALFMIPQKISNTGKSVLITLEETAVGGKMLEC